MICNNCNREIGVAPVCPFCNTITFRETLPHHLPAGTVIGGKYVIKGVLGEGGFGITYLGCNKRLELNVAVKEYFPRGISYRNTSGSYDVYVSAGDTEAVYEHGKERFLSEAKTLVRFKDEPGVVSVIDFVEENSTAYLIMEYLEGDTLQKYIRKHGTMSAEEAFSLLTPVMQTLEKIHKAGVIHRDISPDNIMRLKDGSVKLMDFGAAKVFVDESRSMSVMLKEGYAPEEQYRKNGNQGPWTDVYALCGTIYRCITGKTPDGAYERLVNDTLAPPSALGADISPELERVLLYGLAVRKEDRCQSMTELLALIEQAAQSNLYADQHTQLSDPADTRVPDPYATMAINDSDLPADRQYAVNDRRPPVNAAMRYQPPSPVKSDNRHPYPAPKKKSRKGLFIAGISIFLVLAIVCTGILIYLKNRKEDEPSVIAETDSGTTANAAINSEEAAKRICAGSHHTVGLKDDGTVVAAGVDKYGQCDVSGWTDITAVSADYYQTVGLKNDGTVVATSIINEGQDDGQCDVGGWTDIVAVDAGCSHTVGLKKDGTVVAVGSNAEGQCDVEGWTDIVAVSAGDAHTLGVKKDGTVVAAGTNREGQCSVEDWTDIIAVAAGFDHSVGLKKDGTVVAVGNDPYGRINVGEWTDIVGIAAGTYHTVGVRKDGTVVSTPITGTDYNFGQAEVGGWTDIAAVSCNYYHTVGLKKDGTVVATEIWNNDYNNRGQCDVEDWNLNG